MSRHTRMAADHHRIYRDAERTSLAFGPFRPTHSHHIYHDLMGLRTLLEDDEINTKVFPSFLFKDEKNKKILFDYRVARPSRKPILLISLPRSGIHILANTFELLEFHKVCVSLDHMETYCYRLDERQSLIHQLPTGIPLYSAVKMFNPGQFTHSHLLASDWALDNLPKHFDIIVLDRTFEGAEAYIFSDLIGRTYNKLVRGTNTAQIIQLIIDGRLDDEIDFLRADYSRQKGSIAQWKGVALCNLTFDMLVSPNRQFVELLFETLKKIESSPSKSELERVCADAVICSSFTKRGHGIV